MIDGANQKVTTEHLKKNAYLYVRQSTIRQVIENTESTKRQYALRQRAIAVGWMDEQIQVIDSDLGESGASKDREGFKKLVVEVGLGRAGIVMGLEVSRLARNSSDWHRLLDICAITRTLILDEDGIYDPAHFNDRLLLGLKGTMSEAELHMIRARLTGGMLNKAKRGELKLRLPIGFVYDAHNRVRLDPDKQVQESVRLLFKTFRRVGTAHAALKEFTKQGLTFPKRMYDGPHKGEVIFSKLTYSRIFQVLKNPRYTGAYVYGRRSHERKGMSGRHHVKYLPRDQWKSFILGANEGYISWEEYEENIRRLEENSTARPERAKFPPREGPALLQGLAICGRCGTKMVVRYRQRRGELSPDYCCHGSGIHRGEILCQSIPGDVIDRTVGELLAEIMTPATLEVALAVQEELQARIDEADRLRFKHVERAKYEMELARRRYMNVDPDNRLVADELEAEWNRNLRELREAQAKYERKREEDILSISEEQRKKILALATDFPKLWKDKNTPDRERKRMARLLIDDVTLVKEEKIGVHVRFKGGATRSLNVPIPKRAWEERVHRPEVIAEIDKLLDHHTDGDVASILNERGFLSGMGRSFDGRRVSKIRRAYNLRSYYYRLSQRGLLTLREISEKYGVHRMTVSRWRNIGKLTAYRYDDMGRYLYEDPGDSIMVARSKTGAKKLECSTMSIGGAV